MASTKSIHQQLNPNLSATPSMTPVVQKTESQPDDEFSHVAKMSMAERQALYERKLAEYENEKAARVAQGSKPLFEHEYEFVNDSKHHCPASVGHELKDMHSFGAPVKGALISEFNSYHSGSNGPIEPGMDFTKHIHHGTARIFNADGSVNEENWKLLCDFVRFNQAPNERDIIRFSTYEAFVKMINSVLGYEADTGRSHVITSPMQDFAGFAARQELFDLLSCGYKPSKDIPFAKDKCMKLGDLDLFYRDAPAVFLKAKCGLLPLNNEIVDKADYQLYQQVETELSPPSPKM